LLALKETLSLLFFLRTLLDTTMLASGMQRNKNRAIQQYTGWEQKFQIAIRATMSKEAMAPFGISRNQEDAGTSARRVHCTQRVQSMTLLHLRLNPRWPSSSS
jgi:hypothetical protein